MSKTRKPAAVSPSPSAVHRQPPTVHRPPSTAPLPDFFKNVRLQCALIFGFAVLLYANTLTHGFVLDDGIVITDNMFTKEGVKGIPGILSKDTFFGFFKVEGKETLVSGGRYRPLTLVLFALLYQVVGASPWVFHLLTVLLFAATCVVFYLTLRRLFARLGNDHADLLAWMAAVLFAAHPIHTEVVANVKGCDEIVTLLGCLGATFFALKALHEGGAKWSLLAGGTFFLACLSKENAAAFVVVLPLALWCSLSPSTGGGRGEARIWAASWPIFAAFAVFFVLRGTILHWRFGGEPMELMNNPFLKIENGMWVKFAPAEKLATIFYTLWKYVALLFAPLTLTHDYYPRSVPTMTFGHPMVLLSVALHGFLAVWSAVGIARHRDPVRFGILLYLLSLSIVSNVVFPIGTNMGERFAFMPSAGFCIVAAALLVRWAEKGGHTTLPLTVLGIVVALFALRTVMRNPVWASNDTLFLSDAAHSPNSAKLQNACAGTYFDRAGKTEDEAQKRDNYRLATQHARKALEAHPTYKDAMLTLSAAHYHLGEYDQAIAVYRALAKQYPDEDKARSYLAVALRDGGKFYGEKKGDLATAERYLNESWSLNATDPETARLLGVANGMQGKHPQAIQFFSKAVDLDPKNASLLFDLGTAYMASGNLAKGQELQAKALEMNPKLMEERNR
jgi:protein O-mannosyl-transferase